MAKARQHHWIPQCYLKGFARNRSKNSKLSVLDLTNREFFETCPRNVGGKRDFNRVDIEGVSHDAVENALAPLEGRLDRVLEEINETGSLAKGGDYLLLMNFIALMSIRNPRMRENWRGFQERVANKVMDLLLQSEDRWAHQIEVMRKDGVDLPDISYEQMRQFNIERDYTVQVSTQSHIRMELDALNTLIPCLLDRKWSLLKAPVNSPGFITSDHPVCLIWAAPPYPRMSPGFGLMNTRVVFPLTKGFALEGTFDGIDGVHSINEEMVAAVNSLVIQFSERQVYGAAYGFHYIGQHGALRAGHHLFKDHHLFQDIRN